MEELPAKRSARAERATVVAETTFAHSSGKWDEVRWAQWTEWQGKSWWDPDAWRAGDEQEEPCPLLHCVVKEGSAEDDSHSAEPKTERLRDTDKTCPSKMSHGQLRATDADELAALHSAALRRFLYEGIDLTDSDTEAAEALPEFIAIHGAAGRRTKRWDRGAARADPSATR